MKNTTQFLLLSAASAFSILLLLVRLELVGINEPVGFSWRDPNFFEIPKKSMLFLIWNLFLAWIPYWATLSLQPIYKKTQSKILVFIVLMIWFTFLPNAPYIITDFVHLKKHDALPFWYDITVLSSFAGIGLMLGLLSLFHVERFFTLHTNKWLGKLISLSCIPICGFGIWVGRYQRWNSWDAFTRPDMVLMDIYLQVKDPIANMETLGLSVVITIMILFSYLFMQTFQQSHSKS